MSTLLDSDFMERASPEAIKKLIAEGEDVNAQDEDGRLPLHEAATLNGKPEVIRVLVEAGANLHARDKDGDSPLHVAAGNKNSVVIKILVEAGADVNAQDNKGLSPLHFSARFNKNRAVTEALLDAGADIKIKDENSKTPWDLAIHAKNYWVAKTLKNAQWSEVLDSFSAWLHKWWELLLGVFAILATGLTTIFKEEIREIALRKFPWIKKDKNNNS
ncbi:MAG: ankyrin repeat domain-containing protein [Alphaproteobacteria bacterium GM202ARS2]|nr:ankyrin repeat domain-containing protein [Alphaproteobacteria bacterium GM202ARS2]